MKIQSNAWEWSETLAYIADHVEAIAALGYEVTEVDEAGYSITLEQTLDKMLEVMESL